MLDVSKHAQACLYADAKKLVEFRKTVAIRQIVKVTHGRV